MVALAETTMSMTDETLRHSAGGTLAPTPPFDFAHTLRFLGEFAPTRDEQAVAPETLTRAIFVAGRPLLFRVAASGTPDAPRLDHTIHADAPLDTATVRAAGERLSRYLGTTDDLRPFYAIGRADPAFAPVLDQLHGYHQVTFPTPFENACWAVLTQRTPMAVARRAKDELTRRYGAVLRREGVEYPAFPEAAALADADPDALLEIVGNARRTDYLRAVAEAFAGVDEVWLRAAPYDEAEAWLRAIRGIGAWSAAFILLRGLGRMERYPTGEERLNAIVSRRYLDGREATSGEIARIAAPYGPWAGYWAHYLRVAG